MMLTRETTAGHDFAHDFQVLDRERSPISGPLRKDSHRSVRSSCCCIRLAAIARLGRDTRPISWRRWREDFIVVLPECGRGWFINDHAGKRYEDYLIGELIPLVRETYAAAGPACIGGFSMGGASAFFLALKHPDAFGAAFAVAGAFTAGNRTGDPYEAIRSDALLIPSEAEHDRVWGPPGSAVRAAYAPAALVGQIEGRKHLPRFYFEVGKDDYPRALEASETMRALLEGAGVAFQFAQHEGDHTWAYAAEGMGRLIAQFREGARRHG